MPLDAAEPPAAAGPREAAASADVAAPPREATTFLDAAAPRLAEVQDRLDALVTGRTALTAQAAEAAGVVGDDRLAPSERVTIYSEMFRLRMHDALAEDFPAVRAAVGESGFAELCAAYVAAHPSRSASLGDLGCGFADFLAAQPAPTDAPPWLAGLARLEWALVVAFTAPGGPVLTRENLHGLAPEQWPALELRPVGSWHRCDAPYDVESLRERLLADGTAATKAAERGVLAAQPTLPTSVRVWRKQQRVFLRRLSSLEAEALSRIGAGCRFDDLAEWLAERVSPERASEEDLELLLRWVDDEFLAAASPPPTS